MVIGHSLEAPPPWIAHARRTDVFLVFSTDETPIKTARERIEELWAQLTDEERSLVVQYSLLTGYERGSSFLETIVFKGNVRLYADGDIVVRKEAKA